MTPQLNPDAIKKILIIQIRPFGDVLLNTPSLAALRRRLPRAQIDFLVRHPYQKVLNGNPHIDNCIVFGRTRPLLAWLDRLRLFWGVYRSAYDVVVDQIQGTTSAQVVLASRAPSRIASSRVRLKRLYNIRVPCGPTRYAAAMKFDLLAPLGIRQGPLDFFYHIETASIDYAARWLNGRHLHNRPFVCVSPGSPRRHKKWRAECFARLCDLIMENSGLPVVLLWGPDEKEDVTQVAAAMRRQPLTAPPTTYNQAAAFLKAGVMLICNDGGLYHLSVALKTPSLAIFGGTDPRKWSPADSKRHAFLFNAGVNAKQDDTFGVTPAAAYARAASLLVCSPGDRIDDRRRAEALD